MQREMQKKLYPKNKEMVPKHLLMFSLINNRAHMLTAFMCMLGAILFHACKTRTTPEDPQQWLDDMRRIIIEQSSFSIDSSSTEKYPDRKLHITKSFHQNRLMIEKWYREDGSPAVEKYYAENNLFEYRRELCLDGEIAFEGIFYNGKAYGLSTWWDCRKNKQEQGVRYADQKIGIWKEWKADGTEITTDYRHPELTDSLELIKQMLTESGS